MVRRIELLCEYYEPDGTASYCWAQGKVGTMPTEEEQSKQKKRNEYVIVIWDDGYCAEGEPNTTKQKLPKNKWNKHTAGAWRFHLENDK